MKIKIFGLVALIIVNNISCIYAYGGEKNTNLSAGLLLLFLPMMLGIIYLANKDEVN